MISQKKSIYTHIFAYLCTNLNLRAFFHYIFVGRMPKKKTFQDHLKTVKNSMFSVDYVGCEELKRRGALFLEMDLKCFGCFLDGAAWALYKHKLFFCFGVRL